MKSINCLAQPTVSCGNYGGIYQSCKILFMFKLKVNGRHAWNMEMYKSLFIYIFYNDLPLSNLAKRGRRTWGRFNKTTGVRVSMCDHV